MAGRKKALPAELEGVASAEAVNAIQEKVDKCYSSEKYEDFQEAVEKITWRFMKGSIGWAVLLWLITLVASMLAQKYLSIF